jgi:nucleoside phosphorylase
VDVLVVTALADPEMTAIERLPWNWTAREPLDDVTFIRRGRIDTVKGSFSVVAATTERMGMVSASVLTTKLLLTLRPRLCVMPGICAGIRGRTELGDVICAETVWDYQSGKIATSEDGNARFEMSPHQISIDASLIGKIDELALDAELLSSIRRNWPAPPRQELKIIRAPVATGSAVLADSETARRVIEQNRKLRAIEMELYGVYLSCNQAPKPRPIFFGVKSVCDFAEDDKNDAFQTYAAYTSASVLDAFIGRYAAALIGDG